MIFLLSSHILVHSGALSKPGAVLFSLQCLSPACLEVSVPTALLPVQESKTADFASSLSLREAALQTLQFLFSWVTDFWLMARQLWTKTHFLFLDITFIWGKN